MVKLDDGVDWKRKPLYNFPNWNLFLSNIILAFQIGSNKRRKFCLHIMKEAVALVPWMLTKWITQKTHALFI